DSHRNRTGEELALGVIFVDSPLGWELLDEQVEDLAGADILELVVGVQEATADVHGSVAHREQPSIGRQHVVAVPDVDPTFEPWAEVAIHSVVAAGGDRDRINLVSFQTGVLSEPRRSAIGGGP